MASGRRSPWDRRALEPENQTHIVQELERASGRLAGVTVMQSAQPRQFEDVALVL